MKKLILMIFVTIYQSLSEAQDTVSLPEFKEILSSLKDTGRCSIRPVFEMHEPTQLKISIKEITTGTEINLTFERSVDYTESKLNTQTIVYYAERFEADKNAKDILSLRFENQNLVNINAAKMFLKRDGLTGKTYWVGNPTVRCFDGW